MLKKVVLPAPLGPMIDTIACRGIANETSLTATRPPNALVTAMALSSASSTGAVATAPRAGAVGETLMP